MHMGCITPDAPAAAIAPRAGHGDAVHVHHPAKTRASGAGLRESGQARARGGPPQ